MCERTRLSCIALVRRNPECRNNVIVNADMYYRYIKLAADSVEEQFRLECLDVASGMYDGAPDIIVEKADELFLYITKGKMPLPQ